MALFDPPTRLFRDRADAGRQLAERLGSYAGRPETVVLALPRGGVPVGYEVARALGLPLDVFVVRKLGVPGHEELAMGAIASGGTRVLEPEVVARLGLADETIAAVAAEEQRRLEQRERIYRQDRPPLDLAGKTILLVDDGLATGSSMRAAIQALRAQDPAKVIVAVPIAPAETCAELAREADEVVCAATPEPFVAVGQGYADFSQTSDEEVAELLRSAQELRGHERSNGEPSG
jgi:putative phosphoribosyl transferase